MKGKDLLAKLLGSTAAPAAAVAVAGGKPGLSAEEQAAGTRELENLVETAFKEGRREGRKAERERFGTVLTGEHAADNISLAITLLSTTDNTPEQIAGAITAAGPRIKVDPPAGGGAEAPAGQRGAADPKAGGDPIAKETPLVDLGAPQEPKEGMDDKAIASLWGDALSRSAGGITQGSVWDGLVPTRAN